MRTDLHSENSVFMAMELGNKKWKLRFSNLKREREVTVGAGDQKGLVEQIRRAKEKLGVASGGQVYSCYEAGRDGFWIDRMLGEIGVKNLVVDPSSIEVKQRRRRRKTDRLDAKKLLSMLIRHWVYEEREMWQVVRVPNEASEDERRLHRERGRLKKERGGHVNRIRSLLVLHGVRVGSLRRLRVERLRDWQGKELPEALVMELRREQERLEIVEAQIKAIEQMQRERLKQPQTQADGQAAKLCRLRSIGPQTAWLLSKEVFGWREIRNRRQLGAVMGLTGTPYDSGDSQREQGISKAGNRRGRTACVELAWLWLRYQPRSELSQWFWRRFGHGNKRMRRIGIVALARKILVAMWKYLEYDEMPAGAIVVAD